MCNYNLAWIGDCPKEPVKDGKCAQHAEEKCTVCGAPATHQCAETNGLVCGAPLCDDCAHLLTKEGVNDGFNHCRKTEQQYQPWYIQEMEAKNK